MGYLQVGLVDVEVVVEQDVDVDGTVDEFTIYDLAALCGVFLALAQLPFYLLCHREHLARCEGGLAEDGGVEELVGRLEAPGLRLDERRLAHHRAYTVANQPMASDSIGS